MTDDYKAFLEQKLIAAKPCGFEVDTAILPPQLFDFQLATVKQALMLGKAAIFANTGLGKSGMQSSWAKAVADYTEGKVLMFAPLAVAEQTARDMGAKFGITVKVAASQSDVDSSSDIWISNYEKMHKFNPDEWEGVVLDESSILKNESGKFSQALTELASGINFRLCCSATPAPNDHMEFGTHAEFLGIMSREEMLATFFTHDGGDTSKWRLKGHGESEFWKWLASWAIAYRMPSDIGFDDKDFALPPLVDHHHVVDSDLKPKDGELVAVAVTMSDRRQARKESIEQRCQKAAELVESGQAWMIWCDLNAEADLLEKLIPGAVQISGSDKPEVKKQRMLDFADGKIRVLVSKPSICGSGMNWQHCHNVIFVGINDSFESMYQATNRFHRFGQLNQVNRHLIYSQHEYPVVQNLERKADQAFQMWDEMGKHLREFSQVSPTERLTINYNPQIKMQLPKWLKTA